MVDLWLVHFWDRNDTSYRDFAGQLSDLDDVDAVGADLKLKCAWPYGILADKPAEDCIDFYLNRGLGVA